MMLPKFVLCETVSVSYGCCNKLPQIQWLTTPWTCFPTYCSGGQMAEISLNGLKSGCWQGCFLPEAPGENLFLAFSGF